MFAILGCRHPDTIFQYPDSLNAYPNALQSIQIPSVQQSLLVSECSLEHSNWLSGIRMLPPCIRIASASAARFLLQRIRMLVKSIRIPFKASECTSSAFRYPSADFTNFSSKVKNCLFSIKIVYYLSLLKIIIV